MGKKMKTERNAELIKMFLDGKTAREICAVFKITRQRLYQITKGIKREKREALNR